MINVGVVGYGSGGRVFHAPLIKLTEGLRLHAVCSRSTEKQRRAVADWPGIVTYAGYQDLLNDQNIDLVVLATPHDTHAPLAVQAMDAGKHLVTDKVMCLNETEARQMIAAAERNGVLLSVFQNRRWDGDFLTLQKILADGTLGEIYTIESNVTTFRHARTGWRAWQKHGGGMTRDWGAHLVDQALQLFGPAVESVFADYQYGYPVEVSDVEITSFCVLRFRNGVRYVLEVGATWMYPEPRFHVRGSAGSFRKYGIDPQEAAMKLGTVGLPIPEDPARYQIRLQEAGSVREVPVEPIPGCYRSYYDNISRVLHDGAELLVKPAESLAVIRVIDAIVASAEQGEVVRL